jgi:hypothetical protein
LANDRQCADVSRETLIDSDTDWFGYDPEF